MVKNPVVGEDLPDPPDDERLRYELAVRNCDIDSEYLPVTSEGYLDVLAIIADFCKQPEMLAPVIGLVIHLWEFNWGEFA